MAKRRGRVPEIAGKVFAQMYTSLQYVTTLTTIEEEPFLRV
jgi:hypothetical protein